MTEVEKELLDQQSKYKDHPKGNSERVEMINVLTNQKVKSISSLKNLETKVRDLIHFF